MKTDKKPTTVVNGWVVEFIKKDTLESMSNRTTLELEIQSLGYEFEPHWQVNVLLENSAERN